MSLDLKDLRAKITPEADAALEARAASTGKEKAEIVRELLHEWALSQIQMAKLLDRRLKAEGFSGIGEMEQGQRGR